jgi:hypothetical protein
MKPAILKLRTKDYGLFMDLSTGDAVAVDRETGDVMIRHDGMTGVVFPKDCLGFQVRQSGRRNMVRLRYMDKSSQDLGYSLESSSLQGWVQEANQTIERHRPAGTKQPEQQHVHKSEPALLGKNRQKSAVAAA